MVESCCESERLDLGHPIQNANSNSTSKMQRSKSSSQIQSPDPIRPPPKTNVFSSIAATQLTQLSLSYEFQDDVLISSLELTSHIVIRPLELPETNILSLIAATHSTDGKIRVCISIFFFVSSEEPSLMNISIFVKISHSNASLRNIVLTLI